MYTRKDFGKELKQRVSQKQAVEKIGRWAYSVYFKYMREIDSDFEDLLLTLTTMEEGPEFVYTYEELDRIADDLILGELDWVHLKELSKMRTEDDIIEFEKCLSDIALVKDPAMLGQLIDLFDDQCPYPEIMYSLAQSIESYPSELYIQDLIKKLNDLVENTPYWAGFLFNRVFNSPKDFKIFEENIHLAPVKATIRLLDLMEI